MAKTKVCYVLPVYDIHADTHFAYLYDFLEKAGERLSLFVIVERAASRTVSLKNISHVYVQRFQFLPFRVVENFLALFVARLMGYGNVYVHYSYVAAWNAAWVTRLFTGKTYYWNCGMPWLFGEDRFLKTVLDMVHVVVTGTPRMADLYAQAYRIPKKKINVMPNWIDANTFFRTYAASEKEKLRRTLAIPSDKKIVLFVHRLSNRKGAHFLPEIAVTLSEKNAVVVIVGDGPLNEWIEEAMKENKSEEAVRLVGAVPHRNIALYYALADVFLLPSHEEGFPHVLLEAMAYGVPFVATDVGGVRDIIPPALSRYVVEPDNPLEIAVRAGALLALSDNERSQMAHILQSWVRRYDISVALSKFEDLFISE